MFDRIKNSLWWDKALTLVEGCTPVSPGCDNCWSAAMAHRFNKEFSSQEKNGEIIRFYFTDNCKWTGRIICREDRISLPLKTKKPTVWAVWNDLGHECVSLDFLKKALFIFGMMPHHIFLILTKRPESFLSLVYTGWNESWPKNIWLGVTAENQEQAEIRIPILLKIPAAVHFLSAEPLLGPLDIRPGLPREPKLSLSIGTQNNKSLDWVICGGESGPNARPMHPDWARSLRNQCRAAGVPFFFKQWGEWYAKKLLAHDLPEIHKKPWGTLDREGNWFPSTTPWNSREGDDSPEGEYVMYRVGKKAAGRTLDGKEWLEVPRHGN